MGTDVVKTQSRVSCVFALLCASPYVYARPEAIHSTPFLDLLCLNTYHPPASLRANSHHQKHHNHLLGLTKTRITTPRLAFPNHPGRNLLLFRGSGKRSGKALGTSERAEAGAVKNRPKDLKSDQVSQHVT